MKIGQTEDQLRRQNLFKELISTQGWQLLEAWAKETAGKSMGRIDGMSAKDLNLGEVCEERGFRKGLLKVIQEARTRAEGR